MGIDCSLGELRFDAVQHRYYFGDRRITGITEALRAVGLIPAIPEGRRVRENFAYAADRGQAIHKMCELDDLGKSEEFEFDPNLLGYLQAWHTFKAAHGFVPRIVEKPLGHNVYQYGGTPDVAGEMNPNLQGPYYAVVERKSCDLQDHFGFQLALQELLIGIEAKVARARAYAVRLHPDGCYETREYQVSRYRALALAAVAITNWRIGAGTL